MSRRRPKPTRSACIRSTSSCSRCPMRRSRRISTAISASTCGATATRSRIKTFGHDHRWGSVVEGAKTKALHHLSFGCYADDLPRLKARIEGQGVKLIDPPPGFESNGFWFRNHEGVLIEVKVAPQGLARPQGRKPVGHRRPRRCRRDHAREGAAGAAAPAVACADLHARRIDARSSSTSARWACGCRTAPPISSPSCTASTAATIICWRW